MLRWTIVFFIGALAAASFQFLSVNANIDAVAKAFYFLFISLCIITVIFEEDSNEHKYMVTKIF